MNIRNKKARSKFLNSEISSSQSKVIKNQDVHPQLQVQKAPTTPTSNKPELLTIIYIYDIHAKDAKKFNRVKRLFYYHLNSLGLKKDLWKTKSALAVPSNLEKPLDAFFHRFSKSVTVYKLLAHSVEQLE